MLDVIRSQGQSWGVKIAFAIIIIVFVFWGVGSMQGGPSAVVVSVNEEPILVRDFGMEFERQATSLQQRFPDLSLEGEQIVALKQQVLQQMIARKLVEQEAKRLGIAVSAAELRQAIAQIAVFHNEAGQFDGEVYKRVLENQRNTPGRFEEAVRVDLLDQKMRTLVQAGAMVTDAEAQDMFNYAQERRSAEYISFIFADYLDQVEATDEALQAWYDAHKIDYTVAQKIDVNYLAITPANIAQGLTVDEDAIAAYYADHSDAFAIPERIRARHILIMVDENAPAEEDAKAKAEIEAIASALAEGADFAEQAAQHSQDGTAANGGELGWFERNMMVKPFEDAAFALQVGEVSAPVRSQFGYHLIKAEEYQASGVQGLDEARDVITVRLAEDNAVALLPDMLDKAVELASNGKSLESIATELNIAIKTAESADSTALRINLGLKDDAVKTLFASPVDMVIDTPLEVTDGYMLANVTKSTAEHIPALDVVRAKVELAVKGAEALKLAENAAKDALVSLQNSSATALPEAFAAKIQGTDYFGRDGNVVGLGQYPDLAKALFASPKGAWLAEPQHIAEGIIVVRVQDIAAPSAESWASVAEMIKPAVLGAKRDAMYRAFLEELNAKAVITLENASVLE